jgi:hypothetical protein
MNGYRRITLRRAAKYTRRHVYYMLHGEPVRVLGLDRWGKNALVTLETGKQIVVDWSSPAYARRAA